MSTFQLVTRAGVAIGEVSMLAPDWQPGDVIPGRGNKPSLRVIEVHPSLKLSGGLLIVHSDE